MTLKMEGMEGIKRRTDDLPVDEINQKHKFFDYFINAELVDIEKNFSEF